MDSTLRPGQNRNFTATFMAKSVIAFGDGDGDNMSLGSDCSVQIIQEDIESLKSELPFLTLFSDDIGCRDVTHLYDIARKCHSTLTIRLLRPGHSIFLHVDTLSSRVPHGIMWDPERSAFMIDLDKFSYEAALPCEIKPSPNGGLESINQIRDYLTIHEQGPMSEHILRYFSLEIGDISLGGKYGHLMPKMR